MYFEYPNFMQKKYFIVYNVHIGLHIDNNN